MEKSSKSRKISDRLSHVARSSFVGRQNELALLSSAIRSDDSPFVVAFIHGPGGIGKSLLVQVLLSSFGPDVNQYVMDCRHIEPTPHGFLSALGRALDMPEEPNHQRILKHLSETGQRTVLALDTYETFGLMDTWLRQEFVPNLTDNVLTIIAGRQTPNEAWFTAPGWQGLCREIELRGLSDEEVREMMVSRGLTQPQMERVKRFARGYPLVLEMAATAIRSQPDLEIAAGPPPKILQQLTHVFLAGFAAETVEAAEAASAVRRVTEPLLRALLDVSSVREVFNKLQSLPFIDVTTEGLRFHDVVHDTISKDLAWRDSERYRTYRKRAWHYFFKESRECFADNLWQCTADMLYLIQNPVVREAFFPEGVSEHIVEPATDGDAEDIKEIVTTTEPEQSARLIEQWWEKHSESFSVAKTRDGSLSAFYIVFDPRDADPKLLEEDPLTAAWSRHLNENPINDGERALFLRRWLARTTGEAPSPAQGACWLDIKRVYMALRPSLRRLYTTVTDLATYAPIVVPLGFAPIEEANATVGGIVYHSALLDFGPSSVDGWIASLVGEELGVESEKDAETVTEGGRQLVTVLFTDIVSSTERAAQLGDRRWRDLLERHHEMIRDHLDRFQGREIDTAGDGFFVTFKSPAQGIECACSISKSIPQLGIDIRAGLHLGECEEMAGNVRGIAVHIGARVAALARAGEVLVSRTVVDAVAGSDIPFEERGSFSLKGISEEWRLYAVEQGGSA